MDHNKNVLAGPADGSPPPGSQVGLRQARERDDRGVRIEQPERCDRTVETEIAVNLIGQDHEAVIVGELEQRTPCVGWVNRTSRIVGIDDDQRPRL